MPLREKLVAALSRPSGEIVESHTAGRRRLAVVVRDDGDVQVEFHVEGQRNSPFETLFVVEPGLEASVADEVDRFVSAILNEEIVCIIRGRLFSLDTWVTPQRLDDAKPRAAASWRGSFDRGL